MVSRSDYGGPGALANEFASSMRSALAREGLAKIRSKFASIDHVGPRWVADFLEISDREERNIVIRRVYEKIAGFLDVLGIDQWPG